MKKIIILQKNNLAGNLAIGQEIFFPGFISSENSFTEKDNYFPERLFSGNSFTEKKIIIFQKGYSLKVNCYENSVIEKDYFPDLSF